MRPTINLAFTIELLLLFLAAPALYFPARFAPWLLLASLALLALGWLWRRWQLGIWIVQSPARLPILLFFLLLLMSVWVSPSPLREQYSIPKASILIWNLCLFCCVLTYSNLRTHLHRLCLTGFFVLAVLIAVASLFGTMWSDKIYTISSVFNQLPKPLLGVFQGAEGGFNPNQVAGSLLYALPLQLAVFTGELFTRRRWWVLLGNLLLLIIPAIVFAAAQSRGGLAGFALALLIMCLLPWAWGRWTLAAMVIVGVLGLAWVKPTQLLSLPDEVTSSEGRIGAQDMIGRQEVWEPALYHIKQYPYTGVGLGNFRKVLFMMPTPTRIPAEADLGHAHNFFLQAALDFGIPGLIVIVALYLVAFMHSFLVTIQTSHVYKSSEGVATYYNRKSLERVIAIGCLGALLAQTLYSMVDAVAMGAKTNILFWLLFALMVRSEQHHDRLNKD